MPRVNTATKSRVGKEIMCRRCHRKIEPGERYFYYKFRYGGKYTHCKLHPPRASELTQSKMSGVYAAVEGAEDALALLQKKNGTVEDVQAVLETAADEVESIRDEYQDSLDNMPEGLQGSSTGEAIQEKIDALEEFAQTLRDLDEALSNAEQALGELSV